MVISKFLTKGLMVVCSVVGGVSVLASEARCSAVASQENVQKTPYGYVYSGPYRECGRKSALNAQRGGTPLILKELPSEPISEVKDIVPYLQILPSREERMNHGKALPSGIYKTSQYRAEYDKGWCIFKYINDGINEKVEYLDTVSYNFKGKRLSMARYPSGNPSEFLERIINE